MVKSLPIMVYRSYPPFIGEKSRLLGETGLLRQRETAEERSRTLKARGKKKFSPATSKTCSKYKDGLETKTIAWFSFHFPPLDSKQQSQIMPHLGPVFLCFFEVKENYRRKNGISEFY